MRSVTQGMRLRRGIAVFVNGFLALVVLGGCGMSPTGPGGATPALSCALTREGGHSIDTITYTVACHVTHAAPGEKTFALHVAFADGSGRTDAFDAPCAGTINDAAGSCSQSYVVRVPFSVASASVNGALMPSGQPLGPLTLTPMGATPSA
jgi:hypothetical protein